jgi:predicted transcriptional regulator
VKFRRTKKQREIMGLILAAASDGDFLCVKDIHEKVSYDCSYGAIRISLRALVRNGFLVRNAQGNKTLLAPTDLAYDWFRPGPA